MYVVRITKDWIGSTDLLGVGTFQGLENSDF